MSYQPASSLLLMTLCLGASLPLRAQDDSTYCAFEVLVRSPAGLPVTPIGVSALENGRVFSTSVTDRQGIVRFCDMPLGSVDIDVGGRACGAVTVKNLMPRWLKTLQVFVTFERCSQEFFFPGGCFFRIRVHDDKGSPLSGVRLDEASQERVPYDQTEISDRFGRIFRYIRQGKNLTGQLVKDGYVSKEIAGACRAGEDPFERELVITLEKR